MALSFDAIKRTLKLKGYDEGLDFLSINRERNEWPTAFVSFWLSVRTSALPASA